VGKGKRLESGENAMKEKKTIILGMNFCWLALMAVLGFPFASLLTSCGTSSSSSNKPLKSIWCYSSMPEENLIFFDSVNPIPSVDGNGNAWNQVSYKPDTRWVVPSKVEQPPPEWVQGCGPVWISSVPTGLSPPEIDTYYRNLFTLSQGVSILEAFLTLTADDGAEIWLNGSLLRNYQGSLTSPDATRNYHICNSFTVPAGLFKAGPNVLAIRVPNLFTFEGLNYNLCLVGFK
jgi:hypothetical protein